MGLIKLLVGLFASYSLLWIGLQAIYFFYIRDWLNNDWVLIAKDLPVWSFDYYFTDAATKTLFGFLVFVAVMLLLWMFGSFRTRTGKDGKAYAKLINSISRKRGTRRLQYDFNGQLTWMTLEVLLEYIFYPLLWLQNRICQQFWLPARYRWNKPEKYTIKEETKRNCGGIPIISRRRFFLFGKYNKVYYLTGDHHSLFLGMTGRGKSEAFVKTMLHSYIQAGESMVVHDPKPELYAAVKPLLEKAGYSVIVLNFDKPSNGDCWNPLAYPYKKWKDAIIEATAAKGSNYIKSLSESGIECHLEFENKYDDFTRFKVVIDTQNSEEKFLRLFESLKNDFEISLKHGEISEVFIDLPNATWQQANMSLATELVLDISDTICFEEDARDPVWWRSASSMMAGAILFLFEEGNDDWINFKSVQFLYQIGDDTKEALDSTLFKYVSRWRPVDAMSLQRMQQYFQAPERTKGSYKSIFEDKIKLLTATEDIMRMTSSSTFDIQDIFKQKTAVFLQTQEEKATYYPLVTMFLKQLYEAGIKITKEAEGPKRLEIPMNWVIDEFAILPELKDIEPMISAGRSRGVRMNLFCQSPAQLKSRYQTTYMSIMDNCTNTVYLGSGTDETKEYFVEKAGKKQVWDKRERRYIDKNVVTAEFLNRFERGKMLFTCVEWDPYVGRVAPFFSMAFACDPDYTEKTSNPDKPLFINIKELYDNKGKGIYTSAGIEIEAVNEGAKDELNSEDSFETQFGGAEEESV